MKTFVVTLKNQKIKLDLPYQKILKQDMDFAIFTLDQNG